MRHASAFTLIELLLTLVVLTIIISVAIPQSMSLLGDRRLLRGASQLQVEMTQLRVDAMREGRVMMLEAQLSGGALRVRPFSSLSDATESDQTTGMPSALLSGAKQATVNVAQESPEDAGRVIELPEDVTVESISVVASMRGAQIQQQLSTQQPSAAMAMPESSSSGAESVNEFLGEWSQPIMFYADGTTSTATISLTHPSVGRILVRLRGITGDVTASEVTAASAEPVQ